MESVQKDKPASRFGNFSVKEILFFAFSGTLFVTQAYFWKELITGKISTQPVEYILPIAATIGFAVIFALTATLATARWLGWIILPISSVAAILFIPLFLASYVAAGLIALALIYALHSTNAAYSNSIKLNSSHVIKAGLSGTFTAIALLMSFYYLNIQLTKPINIIPTGLIEGVVSFTSGFFGNQIQEQIPLPKLDQALDAQGGGFSLEGLPPELRNLIPSNLLNIFGPPTGSTSPKQTGSGQTNTGEPSGQGLTKQIANTVRVQIDQIIEPYKPFIPYIFTVFFFLSIRGLMFILTWFITPLAAILLKFLIVVGIVRKEIVQIEAERVFF